MRAKSIGHAEHAILTTLIEDIDLSGLREHMATDEHSAKRFDSAAKNVLKVLDRMIDTRVKHVPED